MSQIESDAKTLCKYGARCYRKSEDHLKKFKHPVEENENTEKLKTKTKIVPQEDEAQKPIKNNVSPRSDSPDNQEVTPPPSKKTKISASFIKQTDSDSPKQVSVTNKLRSPNSKKVDLKTEPNDLIKQLFLVAMPDDFFSFWKMCESLNPSDPINCLKDIKLKLVGPFDVLAGKITDVYEEDLPAFLKHWRYYYDPPEFQTVICCNDSRCYHFGYYRDDPKEMPVFVATNSLNTKNPEKNGEIKSIGPNLFAALNVYLEELITDPFSRMKVPKFQKFLNTWAKEKGFSLEKSSKEMEARNKKVVAKTFHGSGIVVPVDKKNDVGYRELAATNSMIKRMLKGIVESESEEERTKFWEQLQPVITYANIANDECDFGTSLELGLDLFTYGSPLLHRTLKQLLTTAYNLLGRNAFADIIESHVEDRKKGGNLSVI